MAVNIMDQVAGAQAGDAERLSPAEREQVFAQLRDDAALLAKTEAEVRTFPPGHVRHRCPAYKADDPTSCQWYADGPARGQAYESQKSHIARHAHARLAIQYGNA